MSDATQPESLSDLLETVPNIVDHLFRNPPKNALTVYTQMMPGDAVRPGDWLACDMRITVTRFDEVEVRGAESGPGSGSGSPGDLRR